ncbi:hypothetical protein BH24ACT4_BH24ACT4_03240 [soil metagenome]
MAGGRGLLAAAPQRRADSAFARSERILGSLGLHAVRARTDPGLLLALGVPRPRAFDRPCSVDDVAALALVDPYKVHLGRRLLATARDRDDRALVVALVAALEKAA